MTAPQGTRNDELNQAATTLVGYCQQMIQLYNSVSLFIAHNTQRNYGTGLATLPTYTVNADGTQGATDATPNAAHLIVGLNLSLNDLAALLANVGTFKTNMETGNPTLLNAILAKLI